MTAGGSPAAPTPMTHRAKVSGPAGNEPALVTSAVGAVVSYVGSALIAHGVIGSATMSAAQQTIVPALAAGVVLGVGWVTRRFVTPVRWLERQVAVIENAASAGGMTPAGTSNADFASSANGAPSTSPPPDLARSDRPGEPADDSPTA